MGRHAKVVCLNIFNHYILQSLLLLCFRLAYTKSRLPWNPMYPITFNIPKLFATCCLMLITTCSFAQADSLPAKPSVESFPHHKPKVAGSIVSSVLAEGLIACISSAASNTEDHGDKIIGWTYAGTSAAMLTLFICDWAKKSNRLDSNYKRNRITNAITMLGMSYGFSRIATYNLYQATGDSRNKRFVRNMIESNCAYIVPLIASGFVDRLLARKHQPDKKVQSRVYFDGRNLGLVLTFK